MPQSFHSLRRTVRNSGGGRRDGGARQKWRKSDELRIPTDTRRGSPFIFLDNGSYPVLFNQDGSYIADESKRPTSPIFCFDMHKTKIKNTFPEEVCPNSLMQPPEYQCVACYHYDKGDHGFLRRQRQFMYNAIHLAWYHLVPFVNDDGEEAVYTSGDNKGKPILVPRLCTGQACQFCQNGNENLFFGKRGFFKFGTGFNERLMNLSAVIEYTCSTCGADMVLDRLTCPNCEHTLVSLAGKDQKTIDKAVGGVYNCSKCNARAVIPVERLSCSDSRCTDPTPTPFWGRVLFLKRTGEGKETTIDLLSHVAVKDFKLPENSGYASMNELLKKLSDPFDFPDLFTARPPREQADKLGLDVPREWRTDGTSSYEETKTAPAESAAPRRQPVDPEPESKPNPKPKPQQEVDWDD